MLSPLGANKFPNAMGLERVIDPFTKYQDTFSHQDKHSFHREITKILRVDFVAPAGRQVLGVGVVHRDSFHQGQARWMLRSWGCELSEKCPVFGECACGSTRS
jgi:hypothetical protein